MRAAIRRLLRWWIDRLVGNLTGLLGSRAGFLRSAARSRFCLGFRSARAQYGIRSAVGCCSGCDRRDSGRDDLNCGRDLGLNVSWGGTGRRLERADERVYCCFCGCGCGVRCRLARASRRARRVLSNCAGKLRHRVGYCLCILRVRSALDSNVGDGLNIPSRLDLAPDECLAG